MENLKIETRANVKFLVKLGWGKKSIIEALGKVYGDDAPSSKTIYRWIQQFANGREDIEDGHRSGRPSTSTNDDQVAAVADLVEEDHRISVKTIAKTLEISIGSVETFLRDRLNLSKLSARWVPKALRDDQRAQRAKAAIQFLNRFDDDRDNFFSRLVTGDETWIYQYDPESNNGSLKGQMAQSNSNRKGQQRRSWRRFFGIRKE